MESNDRSAYKIWFARKLSTARFAQSFFDFLRLRYTNCLRACRFHFTSVGCWTMYCTIACCTTPSGTFSRNSAVNPGCEVKHLRGLLLSDFKYVQFFQTQFAFEDLQCVIILYITPSPLQDRSLWIGRAKAKARLTVCLLRLDTSWIASMGSLLGLVRPRPLTVYIGLPSRSVWLNGGMTSDKLHSIWWIDCLTCLICVSRTTLWFLLFTRLDRYMGVGCIWSYYSGFEWEIFNCHSYQGNATAQNSDNRWRTEHANVTPIFRPKTQAVSYQPVDWFDFDPACPMAAYLGHKNKVFQCHDFC